MNIRGYLLAKWAVFMHDHCRDMMTDTGKQFMECIDKLDGRAVPYALHLSVQSWTAVTESYADRMILPVALLRNEQKTVRARIIQGMATNWDDCMEDSNYGIGLDGGAVSGNTMSVDYIRNVAKYKNEVATAPAQPTFESSVIDALAKQERL